MNETIGRKPERTYKDRLFRMIFSDRKELLSLYNAINGTHYTNPEELEVNTLENVIYLNMKNDLSFVIDARLSLYEHQASHNPNIPLRDLFYVASLYEKITQERNLYSSSIIRIPTPHFVTFYNGVEEQPETQVMRLSDAFEKEEEHHALELQVIVLNINPGYNEKLMSNCKTLRDYMTYVEKVRTYKKKYGLEEAVERAIRECIDSDVLADFLRTNQSEAKHMSIYEYDEEKHMKQEREEYWQKGLREGKEAGLREGRLELIRRKLAKGKTPAEIAEALEEDESMVKELISELEKNG